MFYCIYYIQLEFETAANEEGSINSLVHFKYSHEIILAEEEKIRVFFQQWIDEWMYKEGSQDSFKAVPF